MWGFAFIPAFLIVHSIVAGVICNSSVRILSQPPASQNTFKVLGRGEGFIYLSIRIF